MFRVVVEWSGVNVVGRAVSVMHFDQTGSAPDVAGLRTAFFNARSAFPVSTTIQVPGTGDIINEGSGLLEGIWNATATPAAVQGSSTDTSAAGVGACISWQTNAIENFHRVRGRTFLVPLSTFAYDQQGTITDAQKTALNAWATAVRALTPGLAIWHRPTDTPPTNGSANFVVAHTLRDRVAYLGSRRD